MVSKQYSLLSGPASPFKGTYICRMKVLEHIKQTRAENRRGLAILVDPDKFIPEKHIIALLSLERQDVVHLVLVGGSLLTSDAFHSCITSLKNHLSIPVVIFPGSPGQISPEADALLLLSLISGRNADLLIGRHVEAAPALKRSGLELIPTGYLLVDCGPMTTAAYMSQALPIPLNKPEVAAITALAGEMLGLQMMYLDGGSGAQKPVTPAMIAAVRQQVKCPIMVGGGLREGPQIAEAYAAGADWVVVGTAFESDPEMWSAELKAAIANY